MARLPVPGSDDGNWGAILNDFLAVEHNSDGSLKSGGSLTAKADKATTISAGAGLTGGGDLSTNRSLAVSFGTTAGTAAQGNDSRITGAVQSTVADAKGDILAATAADTIARLAIGTDGQVLTADSSQATGLRWSTPSSGGSATDLSASRWGCKVMTFTPHDVNPENSQTVRMLEQRLYAFWLPLPVGTLVSGVRIPIQDNLTAAGSLWFTVYQDDGTQLGTTGDVSAAFTAGSGETWRSAALTAAAATTGSGIWVTALATVAQASSLSILLCDITTPVTPLWLFTDKAQYTDGVATPPATYSGTGTTYFDILIGVY